MKTKKIPDFPSIPLDNLLERLNEEFRIVVNRGIKVEENVLERISKDRKIAKKTLKGYLRNSSLPLWFYRQIDVNYSIQDKHPTLFSKWKFVKIPTTITLKLAYFVGHLQGDGCLESNRKRVNFSDEYYDQLYEINELWKELFGISRNIKTVLSLIAKKPSYQLDIGSKVLSDYLHKVFSLPYGKKIH